MASLGGDLIYLLLELQYRSSYNKLRCSLGCNKMYPPLEYSLCMLCIKISLNLVKCSSKYIFPPFRWRMKLNSWISVILSPWGSLHHPPSWFPNQSCHIPSPYFMTGFRPQTSQTNLVTNSPSMLNITIHNYKKSRKFNKLLYFIVMITKYCTWFLSNSAMDWFCLSHTVFVTPSKKNWNLFEWSTWKWHETMECAMVVHIRIKL